jgi:hypothetical protein
MIFPQGGGCQCGSIRYEISGPPTVMYAATAPNVSGTRVRHLQWPRSYHKSETQRDSLAWSTPAAAR